MSKQAQLCGRCGGVIDEDSTDGCICDRKLNNQLRILMEERVILNQRIDLQSTTIERLEALNAAQEEAISQLLAIASAGHYSQTHRDKKICLVMDNLTKIKKIIEEEGR